MITNTIHPRHSRVPTIYWAWMLGLCVTAAIGGLLMAFSPSVLYASVIRENYNSFFDHDAFSTLSAPQLAFVHWIYGVAGAILIGWFSLIAWVVYFHLRLGKAWAWKAVAFAITVKGVINLQVAVKSGYPLDIWGQIVYLVSFWLPLLGAYRHLQPEEGAPLVTEAAAK